MRTVYIATYMVHKFFVYNVLIERAIVSQKQRGNRRDFKFYYFAHAFVACFLVTVTTCAYLYYNMDYNDSAEFSCSFGLPVSVWSPFFALDAVFTFGVSFWMLFCLMEYTARRASEPRAAGANTTQTTEYPFMMRYITKLYNSRVGGLFFDKSRFTTIRVSADGIAATEHLLRQTFFGSFLLVASTALNAGMAIAFKGSQRPYLAFTMCMVDTTLQMGAIHYITSRKSAPPPRPSAAPAGGQELPLMAR